MTAKSLIWRCLVGMLVLIMLLVASACMPIAVPATDASTARVMTESPSESAPESAPESDPAKPIAIDSGLWTSCAVFENGDLKCWGMNLDGQLGGGDFYRTAAVKDVLGVQGDVAAVGVGHHNCLLTQEGGVKCWGLQEWGELGTGNTQTFLEPQQTYGLESGVKQLSVSHDHNCVLMEDGAVRCWGFNGNGRIGIGTRGEAVTRPVDVFGPGSGVTYIDVGKFHSCAIFEGGGAKCWGENTNGQVGNNTTEMQLRPVDVVGLNEPLKQISGGGPFTCAVTEDGGVKCWGANDYGQLGDGTLRKSLVPVDVSGLPGPALKVSASYNDIENPARGDAIGGHACALIEGGAVYCWGANASGELGDGTTERRSTPVAVQGLLGAAVDISTGGYFTCAVIDSGEIQCWGANNFFQLSGDPNAYSATPIAAQGFDPNSVATESGEDFTCAVFSTGRMQCVGFNWDGELGDGKDVDSSTPVSVTELADAVSVASGNNHTCTVTGEGQVKCWGYNGYGQLGTSPDFLEWTPTPGRASGIIKNAVAVSAAGHQTCSILEDGAVVCWGRNDGGQLGVGDTADRDSATPVIGLDSGAVSLALGVRHGCAALDMGEVRCWGTNDRGQVGGSETESLEPITVAGVEGATQVGAAYKTSCAIVAEGAVMCWGAGDRGQLGNGALADSRVPVAAAGLQGVAQLAGGVDHLCARTDKGTVYCWGGNERGELGNGTTEDSSTPVQVEGLTDIVSIGAGSWHTCAAKSDGTLYCWGDSFYGKLGDGRVEQAFFATPVTVSGIATDK